MNCCVCLYQKNNTNKRRDIFYYVCSKKKNGCQAKATVQRVETIQDGQKVVESRLVAVSSPEVHARNHTPEHAEILGENLIATMKQEMRKNPLIPPGES